MIRWPVLALIGVLLISAAWAVPTTGAVSAISSNNATIAVNGITGGIVWVRWGQGTGRGEIYLTSNVTVTGASGSVTIWGTPILGSTTYYASACDRTGCDPASVSFTTLAVTPAPIRGYGAAFNNIVASHFNMVTIGGNLFSAYTNVMPTSVVFGLMFLFIVLGIWDRTKSVRTISITMCIISPFIVSSGVGLMLGVPLILQSLGQALLAAGFAGILLSFIKK